MVTVSVPSPAVGHDSLEPHSSSLVQVVRTAVAGDGMVLVWAPEELRDDEEVVYAAVAQNGLALEYASGRRISCEIDLLSPCIADRT